jgi:hypothetical protein
MDRERIEAPRVDPVKDLELAVEMLDESSAALDPVTAVAIKNLADLPQLGMVNVAADDALDPAAPRLPPASAFTRSPLLIGRQHYSIAGVLQFCERYMLGVSS